MTKAHKIPSAKTKAKIKRERPQRLPRAARRKVSAKMDWRGIKLSVSYEADWLGMSKQMPQAATSHLEIRTVSPAQAALPVTDTGYRSHFLPSGAVESAGGPVAYIQAWLDEAAKAPSWKRKDEQSRQLSLF
jgi:hypothetical protein